MLPNLAKVAEEIQRLVCLSQLGHKRFKIFCHICNGLMKADLLIFMRLSNSCLLFLYQGDSLVVRQRCRKDLYGCHLRDFWLLS